MYFFNIYKKNQRDAAWQYVYMELQYFSTCSDLSTLDALLDTSTRL